MRILCISDTTRSLAFSPAIKEIYKDIDLILSSGDIPLDSYDYVSTMLNSDLYYVFGNHNLENYKKIMNKQSHAFSSIEEQKFYGFMVDGKCIRDKKSGLIIAGLGGCMLYNGGDSQFSEREMKQRIFKLIPTLLYNKIRYGRYLDILITHAPPFGLGDDIDLCHKGYKCFLKFIDVFKPRYLIHGHVHLDDLNAERERKRGETKIINAYSSFLIDEEGIENLYGR